jgi:aspartate carbamoyltransferase catalytic subunit
MLRLGGGVLSTQDAKSSSSAVKGETVEDTMQMLNHYADAVVVRHFEKGTAARMASVATVPVINAGDGAGQHPTQALLDLYTIWREVGRVDNLKVAAVGDMKNGRTIRSLAYLLGKFKKISFVFVSPPALKMGDDIKVYLNKHGIAFTETASLTEGIKDADVVYMTRIQKERFATEAEYAKYKNAYILGMKEVDLMKKKAIIMHPLPRVNEIATEVDASPKAVYFRQARYGVLIRMALLKTLLG